MRDALFMVRITFKMRMVAKWCRSLNHVKIYCDSTFRSKTIQHEKNLSLSIHLQKHWHVPIYSCNTRTAQESGKNSHREEHNLEKKQLREG